MNLNDPEILTKMCKQSLDFVHVFKKELKYLERFLQSNDKEKQQHACAILISYWKAIKQEKQKINDYFKERESYEAN